MGLEFPFCYEKLTCEECGEALHDEYITSENAERERQVYCVLADTLLPSQIVNSIRGLGLSKEEFAEQTGFYLKELDNIFEGRIPTKDFSDKFKAKIKQLYSI